MLDIRTYPDPVLARPSEPVAVIDDHLLDLVDDMLETMYEAAGVGLAAPQVGRNIRLLVYDVSETRDQPCAVLNPEIVERSGRDECDEGCLSVPGLTGAVIRAESVTVEAQGLDGSDVVIEATGLEARCLQHEIDHLDGVLFIDKLPPSEQLRLRDRIHDMEDRARTSA